MFTLDAESLRELAQSVDENDDALLAGLADESGAWADLLHAIRAASAAKPWCPACAGFGEIELPARGGAPDDSDTETLVCPLCRPWAQGFPGYHDSGRVTCDNHKSAHRRGALCGNPVVVWAVAPYGAGEHATEYRGEPVDLDPPEGF